MVTLTVGATKFLCRLDQLTDGKSSGFDPFGTGRDTHFVVLKHGTPYGYLNACPHYDGARMAWRKNEFLNGDGSRIMCGAHGALFRIEDGVCEVGPCEGLALSPVQLVIHESDIWILI